MSPVPCPTPPLSHHPSISPSHHPSLPLPLSSLSDKVLERGNQIEVLVDKTVELNMGSENFRNNSRQLQRNLCWANVKMKLFIAALILFFLYLFSASLCGLKLEDCGA